MAKKMQLETPDGEKAYPFTKTDCVFDNAGNRLDRRMMVYSGDPESEGSGEIPEVALNADLFGGFPPEDYATKEEFETIRSHVGMIIQSTTLDTEEKVIAIYGGSKWSKIEGRFLLGASSSYKVNTTGGEASHTLTINEIPSHTHKYTGSQYASIGSYGEAITTPQNVGSYDTNAVGGSKPHNNMPPYKAVYIWERTA